MFDKKDMESRAPRGKCKFNRLRIEYRKEVYSRNWNKCLAQITWAWEGLAEVRTIGFQYMVKNFESGYNKS